MGSFAGHIDESIFFLALGFWWMLNSFPRHIQCTWMRKDFRCRMSYPLPCKKRVPIEAIMKTAFPVAGFMAEVLYGQHNFVSADGHFQKLINAQHMTIYGMFVIHGVIDIVMSLGLPLPRGLDFVTAAMSFGWYGLSFTFHSKMEGKLPLEGMIHILPTYIMYACALCYLLENWRRTCFIAHFMRAYCLLVLGSWFTHASFILYKPFPFPGHDPNPLWDQSDMKNVHFTVALFGFHCCLQLLVVAVTYLIILAVMKFMGKDQKKFRPLLQGADGDVESDVAL